VVSSRDATRRKRAERERERERERLDRFAGIVSHDLLSPLNVAKGNVEGVRESHDDPRLGAAVEALERMETLVEDTLALARLGRTIGSTERVALGDVVRRAWEGVPTDGATLETPDEATVEADRERLRTVYENLFGNAVKHGGPEVTVRAGVTDGDDGFGLYVEDDGPGVPAAERERVLEAGYTREEGGTGFGLAIVEEIAEAHGWTVRVTAGETGGARFEVTGVRRAD
jgi:signal transduction histidine kinase